MGLISLFGGTTEVRRLGFGEKLSAVLTNHELALLTAPQCRPSPTEIPTSRAYTDSNNWLVANL